jgi:uncharacterized surface protein with fasciclin (FAS1) repeats
MSTRTRSSALVATMLGLSLLAAACGSDDGDATPATQAPTTVASTPATDTPSTDTVPTDTVPTDTVPSDTGPSDTGPAGGDAPFGPACSSVPADGEGSFAGMTDDTAATAASNNPLLSTLVTAVTQAGLVDTLNSDGPFTIFAPVNDAFAALPPADLEAVLADQDLLTSILTLHVVAGESLSADQLVEKGTVTTVNGADLTIEAGADGTVMVNGQATVGCANVMTANATVHIIDAVLMP